ncbi:MAG TPA: TadE/TadG family type IV pilus assembly protein [Acidimicrobiales bacterium]|nr:TadE/TadG family type IV pilus assembly protein [Acidimicrobiales bacterium]
MLIEFALVLPIFAVMLFGMIQFGLVFNGWTSLRNSVQTAARLGAIGDFGTSLACAQGQAASPPAPETSGDMICTVAGLIGQPAGTSSNPPAIGLMLLNNLLTVCAQAESQPFTGFFPAMALSSTSTFYVETASQPSSLTGNPIAATGFAPIVISPGQDSLDYSLDVDGHIIDAAATGFAGSYYDLDSLLTALNSAITYSQAANNISPPDVVASLTNTHRHHDSITLQTAPKRSYISLQLTGGGAASKLGFTTPSAVVGNDSLQSANPYGLSGCMGLSVSAPATSSAGTPIGPSQIVATLAGTRDDAGGHVTFTVFQQTVAPTTCTSGGLTLGGPIEVSGDGRYNPSTGYSPVVPGNYWWYASYGGDANNRSVDSACGSDMAETVVG